MSKLSKQRACPALGRDISSAHCGEQRQSRLACPADCPHNPFAPENYSRLLEIEDRLDAQTRDRFKTHGPEPRASQRTLTPAELQSFHAPHAFFVWQLFYATDATDTTFVQRWEQTGWGELKNDEQVLLRGKMQMRIVLLEVHRVLPGGQVEAVDLLSSHPTPLLVQDRSFAGQASRFSTLLTWAYPLPHYWRTSGSATNIPDLAQFSAPEIVREITRHLGGPLTDAALRRWLAENFARFDLAMQAVSRARRQQMFASLDAKWGRAVYELKTPFANCRRRLDELPDVAPDELTSKEKNEGFAEARAWMDRFPPTKFLTAPGGQVMLGRVLLGQSIWRLETMGAEKLSRLRREFETGLGVQVRFTGERLDDLGAQLAAKDPVADQTLVPPRLLENPDHLSLATSRIPALPPGVSPRNSELEMLRAADRAFLDEPIPALDNHTPRQAARTPDVRPKLVELMKKRVRRQDEHNLQTGRTADINWLLRELELTEIIFDAPPWRPPPAPRPEAEAAFADDDFSATPAFDEPMEADPDRTPAPRLTDAPWELAEAFARLKTSINLFSTAAGAEAELDASGATMLDDVEELTQGILSENDFDFAVPFLLHAWFALMPPGCRAPEISFADLETAFASNLRQLEAAATAATPKKLEAFFQSGAQPGLMTALVSIFVESAQSAPREFRPSLGGQPVMLALLKSVVDQLDAALRRQP